MSDIVERLAPCPFCGEVLTKVESWAKSFQPARLYHEYHHPDNGCIMVTGHPALFWAGPATDAPAFIAAWNRRSDATITALREEVEAALYGRHERGFIMAPLIDPPPLPIAIAEVVARAKTAEAGWKAASELLDAAVGDYNTEHDALTALRQRVVEVLGPFAEAADAYDPPDESENRNIAWAHDFTIGSLRAARALISEIKEANDGKVE